MILVVIVAVNKKLFYQQNVPNEQFKTTLKEFSKELVSQKKKI